MNPSKPGPRPSRAAPSDAPDGKTIAGGERGTEASAPASARKTWKPKTPIEVVIEQIHKQEKKVADLEHDLDREKGSLNKLLQAKKVLES